MPSLQYDKLYIYKKPYTFALGAECGWMELFIFLIRRRGVHIILAYLHGFLYNLFNELWLSGSEASGAEETPISVPAQQNSPYQL